MDAICASGVMENLIGNETTRRYYDTYATVLNKDTFLMKLENRLIPRVYEGENVHLVRTDEKEPMPQFLIAEIFRHYAKNTRSGAVRVRSCFGGFTLYRAKYYLREDCKYQLDEETIEKGRNDSSSIMRYASAVTERPCEHVVLHDCLHKDRGDGTDFRIAVHPKMRTRWSPHS